MVVGWSRGVGLQVVRAICAETWRVTRSWRPQLRVGLEYRGDADDEQLTLPDAAAPVDQVHTLYAATSLASRVMLLLCSCISSREHSELLLNWTDEGTVRHRQSKEASLLWSHHEETRELAGERDNARNNARCTQARKTTHGLDGQHQDVDRTPRGRVSQNDRGQG